MRFVEVNHNCCFTYNITLAYYGAKIENMQTLLTGIHA